MRGVIMETKNGRAVLLTKGGEFINVKDKGYSVGDKINTAPNTGRLCALAASFAVVCAGIGSYFIPSGYVSVDINPSLMMTINVYNRVIDVESLNDDAKVLLNKIDIKGKSAEDSVEMLIKTSEEIGYINDNNRDVILEVVPGIRKPHIEDIKYHDIDITKEASNIETLRMAQNIGVSIAKAKAIEEYTEKNGGDMRSNAAKFNDKSIKEIRSITFGGEGAPDKKPDNTPAQEPKPQEPKPQESKSENIPEPPKPPQNENRNSKPRYNTSRSSLTSAGLKRSENVPSADKTSQNERRPLEISSVKGSINPQEIQSVQSEPPHRDIAPANNHFLPPEQNPQDGILQITQQQTAEADSEKPSADSNTIYEYPKPPSDESVQPGGRPQDSAPQPSRPIHWDSHPADGEQQVPEQSPPSDASAQPGGRPQDSAPQPSRPIHWDSNPTDGEHQAPEQNPQDGARDQNGENPHDNPSQPGTQNPTDTAPTDEQPEHNTNITEQDNAKPQDPYSKSDREPVTEPDSQPSSVNDTYKPQQNPQNNPQPSSTEHENNAPPKAESKPPENTPPENNNAPQPDRPPHGNDSPQNNPQQSEPKPPENNGDNTANESVGDPRQIKETP